MQPESPIPSQNAERQPSQSGSLPDRMPVLPTPEAPKNSGLEGGAEKYEQTAELSAAATDVSGVATPQVSVQPVDPSVSAVPLQDDSNSPISANDDDVIEKEWVDRAKQIITDTKDDPYQREEQASKLQKDYLKKRYGKDLGVSPQS